MVVFGSLYGIKDNFDVEESKIELGKNNNFSD